jgi:hypothetical protein
MTEEKLTTVQASTTTRDKLKMIGKTYKRTAAAQLEWMVDQEYLRLKQLNLLPEGVEDLAAQDLPTGE